MKQEPKDLLLLQRLIDRLNSECVTMSYTLLADYLIANYHRLGEITIEGLCRETFVSKSTVRRFCRAMGYRNFTDLKQAGRPPAADDYPAGFSIRRDLAAVLEDFPVPEAPLMELCALLEQPRQVFLLLPENLLSVGHDFQRRMACRRRLIYLVPNLDRHFTLIQKPLRDALLILLDADRAYTASLLPYLERVQCSRVCIRTGAGRLPAQDWAQVIHLGGGGSPVQDKYRYAFFLDTVAAAFRQGDRGTFCGAPPSGRL